MSNTDEKGLNGAGLSTLWSKISSLFIRKTEVNSYIKSYYEDNKHVVTPNIYVSGTTLVIKSGSTTEGGDVDGQ